MVLELFQLDLNCVGFYLDQFEVDFELIRAGMRKLCAEIALFVKILGFQGLIYNLEREFI